LQGLARVANICRAVWGVLARLDDICQSTFLRKMVTKQHFFQGLANLVNLPSLAITKCQKTGKCWDSPCSLTFAKQFCKDLPTFAKHFCQDLPDLPDLPSFAKNHFEKIMTRLT
jgi:hypothetical protein